MPKDKPPDHSNTEEQENSPPVEREFNLDTSGLELMPPGVAPGVEEKLPGQFNEHQKTLDRIEANWKRIDRRKWIRRQCADRRKEIRFGGRDRRLAKFDRRRSQRGWRGEWN